MDTMILESHALEKMLSEYATDIKLQSLGKPLREILLESGMLIGYLRWASRKYNLNIDFKFLNFYRFVDIRDLSININKLYKELKTKSSNKDMDYGMLKKYVNGLVKLNADTWNICQGHDLVEILTIGLKEIFGNHAKAHLDSDIVSKNLRLAYNLSYFIDTKLYASIKRWEESNSEFRILLKS